MADNLSDQVDVCEQAILAAILEMLRAHESYIGSIKRTGRGELPISGIALELFPWYGGLGLSLRLQSDFPLGQARYDSADWPHFDFTQGCVTPTTEAAIAQVTQLYQRGKHPPLTLCETAHLAFLAGARALLNPAVARLLNEFEIRAPEITDSFVSSPFQYILTDADQTIKSNYCDIVLSERVAKRLLGGKT